MYNSKPYTGSTTKLVVAFDIGTILTGISYCILEPGRVPEVLDVTRFPAQELKRGDTRVPLFLYYDRSGSLKAAGAEVLSESINETALEEGWVIAMWCKFRFLPGHLAHSVALPPLPPGKSALDLLTDFIRYIFDCARTYIREHHSALIWSTVEDSIEYIFTHPSGWDELQQQYRQAIERAGLVHNTPQGQARIHLLTEGEASLHFCFPMLLTTTDTPPRGVVVIGAGSVTVDLSMYLMTVNPISCKEIAVAECRLQGSAFVTDQAEALLKKKLQGWDHSSEEEINKYARVFNPSTKSLIKRDREPAYIRVADRSYNSLKYYIAFGELMLTGEEATSLFNASFNAIIGAFEKQLNSVTTLITTAFLVGELSTNDWLWYRLKLYFGERKIDIYRPDNHINKAVANGAVMSYVDHLITARVARATYGVVCALPVDLRDQQHIRRQKQWETDPTGNHYVPGYFGTKLLRGTQVNHETEFRESFSLTKNDPKDFGIQTVRLEAYRGELTDPKWVDEDKASFSTHCTIRADLREAAQDLVKIYAFGGAYYQLDYNVTVLFGLSELQAYFGWKTREGERRVQATVLYEPETLSTLYSPESNVREEERRIPAVRPKEWGGAQPRKKVSASQTSVSEEPFETRSRNRLENLSDDAMKSGDFKRAAKYLSTVLSFKPENRVDVLIKRSRARALMKSWDEALNDAKEVIDLSPSSHHGYELEYAALYGTRRFAEAVEAFGIMLLKLKGSPDECDRVGHRYVDPRPVIQTIVESVVRPTPRMLIDTVTGRLYDKQQQMEAFKELPIYNELVLSMTRKLNETRIREVVEEFYRYVMFSHRWGEGEPLLQDVKNISIYDLKSSPGSTKLQNFCLFALGHDFRWAWSDTCCIDKDNNVILQESLVSMFKWYRGSSLTIVHLLGVPSAFQRPGGLRKSIWNSRGWTYQEYVAAKTVLFYTEDWQPYHGLEVPNHKESSVIISEMQQVTGDTTSEMAVVQPGLDRVREKLYLASMRCTTLEEDAAYSLFGIFNVSLPVIYGEGDHAVGRLLDHVLNGSGDVSILAWTGTSGSYNSCLPRDLRVYDRIVPPHIPLPMEKAEMDRTTNKLRSSLSDLSILMKLHKRLNKLPLPSVSASRLKLPGIVCSVTNLTQTSESPVAGQGWCVYHAKTSMLGDIKIKTREDLTGMQDLCLVHPWIRPLLDQEHSESGAGLDTTTRTLRLVSRLKQPFGALLLWSLSRVEHRRVAVDSLIMAQMDRTVSLEELIECFRTVEIQ